MKKTLLILTMILVSIFVNTAQAQEKYQPTQENLEARTWFSDARFGMFIHWGASSVLGAGEWVMNNRNIHVEDYRRLQNFFNPQDFDAKKWVAIAKNAGMKYITFVSRHHDSFSNWDTKQSDWKITNTPYGQDIIKQLADECHREGIKLFFYYSTLDWFRSDYQYETGRTGKGTGRTEKSNWPQYINFMKAQLTELLTNYGEIAGIWFDGHWDQTAPEGETDRSSRVNWHYDEIYKLIHDLQPQCLIGNNHHLDPFPGEDFQMFERDLPGQNKAGLSFQKASEHLPLETCQTISESWGFNMNDVHYKPAKEIIHLLAEAASLNANLLLNIGPMPDGNIQPQFISRLDSTGQWMKIFGQSIYGTTGSSLPKQDWGVVTQKNNELYLHILNDSIQTIEVNGLDVKPENLYTFKDDKLIKCNYKKGILSIDLTNVARDPYNTVLKLKVRKK